MAGVSLSRPLTKYSYAASGGCCCSTSAVGTVAPGDSRRAARSIVASTSASGPRTWNVAADPARVDAHGFDVERQRVAAERQLPAHDRRRANQLADFDRRRAGELAREESCSALEGADPLLARQCIAAERVQVVGEQHRHGLTQPRRARVAAALEGQHQRRSGDDDLRGERRCRRHGEQGSEDAAAERHAEGASGAPTGGAASTGAPTPIRTSTWHAASPSA